MNTKLTDEQKAVVTCNDKYIVCSAAAGSGKTFTMIQKIIRLVNNGVAPESILGLTFTNAAAHEMKQRYMAYTESVTRIPEFRTFHGFCYNLLSCDKDVLTKMGYTSLPSIADDSQFKKISNTVKHNAGIKLTDAQLESSKKLTPKQEYEKNLYNKLLKKQMYTTNTITFDELCDGVCELFYNDDDCIKKYKEKYKYIFIDEFQDTDPVQWNFAKSFEDANLFVCGDICQGIYSFRNADSSIMKRLINNPDWTVLNLTHNFRSTKNIVNYANSVVANTEYGLTMKSNVDGPMVNEWCFEERNKNYKYIHHMSKDHLLQWIKDYKEKPYEGSVAILDRTNAHVDNIKYILKQNGIEYTENTTNSEIPYIFKSISDNEYLIQWTAGYLSNTDYIKFLRMEELGYPDSDESHIVNFYKYFGSKSPLLNYRLNTVFQIRVVLQDEEKTQVEKCKEVFELLEIKAEVDEDVDISTLEKLFDYIESVYEKGTASTIYVGTIHSVKGLEFDQVLLFSVNDIGFDLTKEDNLNLYYVGVTRAKKDLTVFTHV